MGSNISLNVIKIVSFGEAMNMIKFLLKRMHNDGNSFYCFIENVTLLMFKGISKKLLDLREFTESLFEIVG